MYSAGAVTLPVTNFYCLGKWGYYNVVPTLNLRPPRLSENSELLSGTLTAGARSLRYALGIPVTVPHPFPPELRAWSVKLVISACCS